MADHPQHAIMGDLDGPTSAFSEERARWSNPFVCGPWI